MWVCDHGSGGGLHIGREKTNVQAKCKRGLTPKLHVPADEAERLAALVKAHGMGLTVPRSDYNAMAKDRDRLRADNARLAAERDEARLAYLQAMKERDEHRQSGDAAKAARDECERQLQAQVNEVIAALEQRDVAKAEVERLTTDLRCAELTIASRTSAIAREANHAADLAAKIERYEEALRMVLRSESIGAALAGEVANALAAPTSGEKP